MIESETRCQDRVLDLVLVGMRPLGKREGSQRTVRFLTSYSLEDTYSLTCASPSPGNTKPLTILLILGSFGLLPTPKCATSCCLLREEELILVLALAKPNLEASQLPLLLHKYQRFQSHTGATSDSSVLQSHPRRSTTLL